MRSRPKHLCFITATLLLSVASPLFAFTCDFKPLIAQAQTAQDRKAEVERLFEEASRQMEEGQFQKAIESLEQALPIYREIAVSEATPQEIRLLERETLLGIGLLHLKIGQYDQIPKIFRQILAIDRELGDRRQPKSILFVSGLIQEASNQFSKAESDETSQEPNSQLRERQYQKALELFQLALSLYHELGVSEAPPKEVRRLEKHTLFMIGQTYLKLDQYDQGLKFFQESLALDQELGDRCQEQETLFKISSLYGVLGQYDQVLEGLDKILAINRELEKPCDTFLFHDNDITDIYQMLGQPEKALKMWEQALAIYRKLGDRKQEKLTLFVISRLYQQQRQYDQALAALQKVLSINRELGDYSSEQSTLIRIGEIYEQQGQYEQALDSYQQALTLNRKPSNPFGAINSFMRLSRVYQRLGQYEQALESYQQALAAGRSVGNNYFNPHSAPSTVTQTAWIGGSQ
jgi:tetratricopeptide (TPR) repeat protein